MVVFPAPGSYKHRRVEISSLEKALRTVQGREIALVVALAHSVAHGCLYVSFAAHHDDVVGCFIERCSMSRAVNIMEGQDMYFPGQVIKCGYLMFVKNTQS